MTETRVFISPLLKYINLSALLKVRERIRGGGVIKGERGSEVGEEEGVIKGERGSEVGRRGSGIKGERRSEVGEEGGDER